MKIFAFYLSVVLFFSFEKAPPTQISEKNLIGVWQAHDTLVGSGYQALYVFLPNHKFIFYISQYSILNPLSSLEGNYRIKNNSILVKIRKYSILEDFTIVPTMPAIYFGQFQYDGGKIKEVILKDSTENAMPLKSCNSKIPITCIEINEEKFFKLYDDPKRFFKENNIDK